ncbi:LiaI-LiaF-like domain-containing protein [Nanoarchaeota archaeon]
MGKDSSYVWGAIFILVGVIFLLRTTGLLDFTLWPGFVDWWPLFVVLIGLAMVFKQKTLALAILLLLIVFAVWYFADEVHVAPGDYRSVVQKIDMDYDVTEAELEISYGAGEIDISAGSSAYLFHNVANTTDIDDPSLEYEKDNGIAHIHFSRKTSFSLKSRASYWAMALSPDVVFNIEMDYGASEGKIDLRTLKVAELDIDSGASETEIILEAYPTFVEIDTGASELNLKFPEGFGASVEVHGGALDIELEGFTKEDKKYVNSDYDEDEDNIIVEISAGASSIQGEIYG